MTHTRWTRRAAGAALAVTVAAALPGCSTGTGAPDTASTTMTSPAAVPGTAPDVRVVLLIGDRAVAATLADTPQARQFAGMLPVTVRLKDVWGQAKSGRLPRPLAADAATPVHDPAPGDIYFWPTTEVIAIYYDDLGQTVPAPGLVRLGVVDTGLRYLADAGHRFTVRIERAAATTF